MITAVRRRLARSLSTIVAVVILLFLVAGLVLFGAFGSGDSVSQAGDNAVAPGEYRSLVPGSSRDEIEQRLGDGQDALEFEDTGVALEPMDAECIYYPQEGTGNYRDIIQLCFREDRLVQKRMYASTPGPPLVGAGFVGG